jgi:hypothetical protein
MRIVALEPAHLAALRLQDAQALLAPLVTEPGYADMLIAAGPAFAGVAGGRVVGCAGIVMLSVGRGHAWALLGSGPKCGFIAVHRAVAGFLDGQRLRRIETAVDSDFAAGHRWARMLGFAREGRMRAYGLDGRDADLYARVR